VNCSSSRAASCSSSCEWLTFSQTLESVIAGCEAAWSFYGGIFKVVIPDNMKAIVINADPAHQDLIY
jgi:transposase